jgi:regulator of protease activity HflC (stomatin/prohibitin superfamily)
MNKQKRGVEKENFMPRMKRDFTLFKLLLVVLMAALFIAGITGRPGAGISAVIPLLLTVSAAVLGLGVLIVPSIKKVDEWQRAVVLRLGRFHRVAGPGLFFLIPIIDRVSQIIDIRIRVTDFSAQEALTGDSVTVNVDAFAFWLVWDPQKAALEVENYEEAVVLAAKAAMRKAVSRNDLSTFLARGDLIEKQIQEEVDRQTTEWGITVQYVEITDLQIPGLLQEPLSRLAVAEREKRGRVLLAEAEIEIAGKLEEAVSVYAGNEPAMKLKILSILNEGLKAGNSMMLIPNSIAEELKTKDVFGLAALNEIKKEKEGDGK